MRTRRSLVVLPALLLGAVLLAAPQPAEAQYYGGGGYGYGAPPPRPQFGFRHRIHGYVGGQLTGIATVGQTLSERNNIGPYLGNGGGGGGLFGGIRLGPFFSLEVNWNITWHQVAEDYWGNVWSAFHLQTIELNGKIHIPTRSLIEPYIQVGVGFAFLGVSWDDAYIGERGDYLLASGVDFNVGGGLDFWLSPFLSVGGRVLYKGMRFGEMTHRSTKYDANYASAINLDVNLTLHF